MSEPRGVGRALARAALAGNPSDLYGGAVLAVTLPMWEARAEAIPDARAANPPNELVEATVRRFGHPAGVRWSTSIPQRVGLGSSSALVIAVTRALCSANGVTLSEVELAEFALAVEAEELGITAGLQDRIAQAFEGLTFMDFAARAYESLDPGLLPPLLIAWREDASGHSGDVHARTNAAGMAELAAAAHAARAALLAGDPEEFAKCVDCTFDLREQLMELDPRCVAMVKAARSRAAAANYTGSGGAIVAVCRDEAHVDEVSKALRAIGAATGPVPAAGYPTRR